MKPNLQNLMQDPSVARRLMTARSLADAAVLLADAAAAGGWRLGRRAARGLLAADPAAPRELSAAELLAVGGGTRGASRTTASPLPTVDGPEDELPE